MQDNFDLKGFLRNNTLLNEGIGGYFDLKPLKEYGADPRMAQMDIDQDFIERVHQELTPEESAWLVDNVDKLKAQFFEKFAELEGDVDGMTALVKQLYFEKDADSEMTELNDLGNMEEDEEEDGFIQAQRDAVGKKGSQIFDKGWEYDDDDETMDTQRYSANYDRLLSLGGDKIEKAIIFLLDDGFDTEDILDFVKTVLEDNANTGD
jgi:hypothetical protein